MWRRLLGLGLLLGMFVVLVVHVQAGAKGKPVKCPPTCPSPSPSPSPSPTPPACTPMDDSLHPWLEAHSTTIEPNCVTVQIEDGVTNWTPDGVYAYLVHEALDLDAIGPKLTIRVILDPNFAQTSGTLSWKVPPAGETITSCSLAGTCEFVAVMTLVSDVGRHNFDPADGTFAQHVISHEYGHVWTMHYLVESHRESWQLYIDRRPIDPTEPINVIGEIAAEDYRICFGSAEANEYGYSLYGYPYTKDGPGFCQWMLDTWKVA